MLIEFKNNNKNKFVIFIICIEFLFLFKKYARLNDSKFESYYSKYLCSFLILNNENNCIKEVFNNYDFFYFIKDIKKNVNLTINMKNVSLIENIMMIIGIIPFLKNNSVIRYVINDSETNKIFRILFKYKKIENGQIYIDFSDFKTIKNKLGNLINFIWEIIPQKHILNNIRYIINNYYDDSCINFFEKALNKNYEYFIKKNQKIVSVNSYRQKLLSK